MTNLLYDHVTGLFLNEPAGVRFAKDTNNTIIQTHDSVMVATLVVKEHGECLLIKLPEAASKLAALGNTVIHTITCVFPRPYRSSKKVMQASFFELYPMSAS